MGIPSTAIYQESIYLGDITQTTDADKGFPVFYNNSGLDIVITEAAVSSVKGLDAARYMTVNLKDADDNTISTLAYTVVSTTLTVLTAMGDCSATHGVIPDGEFVSVVFAQTNDGDNLADFSIHFSWKYQTPQD